MSCKPSLDPCAAIPIVYEDEDLLVVEKPAGMVVHPACRHLEGTLWHQLSSLFEARGLSDHPRLLHRLDRDTSGLLCVPKHLAAHRILERALRGRRFSKGYLALVHGTPAGEGLIDAPLARDPADRRRVVIAHGGQSASTRYHTLRRFPGYALLRVQPETGRTHQIRVHLASGGHPVVGDPLYGPMPATEQRLFLHADRLVFPHPMRQGSVVCRSALPAEFRRLMSSLSRRALPEAGN